MEAKLVDYMGNDNSIVNAARVSFAKLAENYSDEKNAKLIKYLADNNHWSPFAHATITLHMKAPIAIHAQCAKHQVGFAMNTVSRRYVKDTPELFIPIFRYKPEGSIKQGSGEDLEPEANKQWMSEYKLACEEMINTYESMIKAGISPEQARFVLPQGVYTEWYWTGSLYAWARFYNQRSDSHAQKEIQHLASLAQDIIQPLFPISWEVLTNQ